MRTSQRPAGQRGTTAVSRALTPTSCSSSPAFTASPLLLLQQVPSGPPPCVVTEREEAAVPRVMFSQVAGYFPQMEKEILSRRRAFRWNRGRKGAGAPLFTRPSFVWRSPVISLANTAALLRLAPPASLPRPHACPAQCPVQETVRDCQGGAEGGSEKELETGRERRRMEWRGGLD